ncbi:carbohydrate kinase family protein [Candidatus Woesearchaeota archaeon]|nr:carbohydrate kinase family protein [Candidatus Woesearchaeota archaeon]
MHDVITIGCACYDIFIYTNPEIIKLRHKGEEAEHIAFPSGAKILINQSFFDIGGGATNTAAAFSRLGLKTGCIFKAGKDNYGDQILRCMKKEGVKFLGKIGRERTDFSIVLDSKGHDRTVLVFKDAGCKLDIKDIKARLDTKWLYVSSSIKKTFRTSEKIAREARKRGVKIGFNPSTYLATKGYLFLKKMLKTANVLILNKEEAEMLTGNKLKRRKEWGAEKNLLWSLSLMGPEIVVITDGPNGAYALKEGIFYKVHPHKNAKVIETAGAGDAFASSFIAGLIKGKGMEYSLKLGVANAESVISHIGAHNKLLNLKEAEASINKDAAKVSLL